MGVRVLADVAGRAFFVRARRTGDHRMRSDDSGRAGHFVARVGARDHSTLPAQAHVAAWVQLGA